MVSQGCQILLEQTTAPDLGIYFHQCIPISECPYQLKMTSKKIVISSIPLMLDNDFSRPNNFQTRKSVLRSPGTSLMLIFKNIVQNISIYV